MEIRSTLTNRSGHVFDVVYQESDPLKGLDGKVLSGVHAYCFYFQDIYEPDRIIRQVRSFCIVEPIGNFAADPDGDVTEIKLIDPKDYKQYFDWGKIGERVMSRAMELKKQGL